MIFFINENFDISNYFPCLISFYSKVDKCIILNFFIIGETPPGICCISSRISDKSSNWNARATLSYSC